MDIEVESVGKTGECVVVVKDADRVWSRGFDLLTGDVDELAADLERRMSEDLQGESPLAVLLRRRIAGARAELRAKLRGEVMEDGKGPGNEGEVH